MRVLPVVVTSVALVLAACSSADGQRGIADKRSNFDRFLPMEQNPSKDGLKEVKPFFRRANRTEILRAIDRACQGGRSGSSVFDPATDRGYYVNCNPRNRQLLNGYVPINPRVEPHSRP